MADRILHAGTATLLLELGGQRVERSDRARRLVHPADNGPIRILTDPAFDAAGREYRVGPDLVTRQFRYTNLAGAAIAPGELGQIDLVLVSHDQHDDNLDAAGRAVLAQAKTVITTRAAAKRLKLPVQALAPWESTTVALPDGRALKITATPARHGPPLSEWLVGEVIGFVLELEGRPPIYISGDTVLYAGVREVARRFRVGTAILHVGAATFGALGISLRFTMDAAEAASAAQLLGAPQVIPIHYTGWTHFKQGRADIEGAFERAGLAERLSWLPLGQFVPF